MVGSAGILALWIVSATPSGPIDYAWATDDTTQVQPAEYRDSTAIEAAKALFGVGVSSHASEAVFSAQSALEGSRRLTRPSAGGEATGAGTAYASDYPLTNAGFQDENPFQNEPPVPPPHGDERPAGQLPRDPGYPDGIWLPDKQAPDEPWPPPEPEPAEAPCGDDWQSDRCSGGDCGVCAGERGGLRGWLWGICVDGWIDQGFTINADSPRSRSNFPVTFNDRSNDYQMNQLYVVLERAVDECGGHWDVGGRVDLLYGADSIFTTSRGLEVNQDLSPDWNSGRYGLAMPQFYMEVAVPWGNGVTMKLGHFYTILGYEGVPAPVNFFYSHSYAMQYGEPFTHTGFLGTTQLGSLTLRAGMTRGWDNWEDNNNDLGFLGGISWASWDGRTSIAYDVHVGREQDEPPPKTSIRTLFSLVVQHKFTNRLEYVAQYDHGFEEEGAAFGRRDAKWFGFNQYLFYKISETWKGGLRYEWFRDEDATRVTRAQSADYFELTLGLNWTPNDWLTVRPSFRWDWVDTPGLYPFADGTGHDQIILDCDLIMRF